MMNSLSDTASFLTIVIFLFTTKTTLYFLVMHRISSNDYVKNNIDKFKAKVLNKYSGNGIDDYRNINLSEKFITNKSQMLFVYDKLLFTGIYILSLIILFSLINKFFVNDCSYLNIDLLVTSIVLLIILIIMSIVELFNFFYYKLKASYEIFESIQ